MNRDSSPPEAAWPTPRTLARWLLVTLALLAVFWLLYTAGSALLPFVIGLVLAYLLLPPVNRLGAVLPRWAAILIVYLVSFGLLIGVVAYVVPLAASQTSRLVTQTVPNWYNNQLPDLLDYFDGLLQQYRASVPAEIQQAVDEGIVNAERTLRGNAVTYLTSVGNFLISQVIGVVNAVIFLFGFLIVPFWLFYVLKDHRQALAAVDRMIPRVARLDFWNIMSLIDRSLSGYIRGQLLLGLIVGVTAGAGLLILNLFGFNIEFVLLLAIIAGLTELIPIVGPLLGAIPAVIVGLSDGVTTGIAVAVLYFAIQQLENQFLVPRVVGESLNIHPAVLMVTLIIGGQLLGLLGIILAAPLTAISRDIFVYLYHRLQEPAPDPAPLQPVVIDAAMIEVPPAPPEPAGVEPYVPGKLKTEG